MASKTPDPLSALKVSADPKAPAAEAPSAPPAPEAAPVATNPPPAEAAAPEPPPGAVPRVVAEPQPGAAWELQAPARLRLRGVWHQCKAGKVFSEDLYGADIRPILEAQGAKLAPHQPKE